VHEGTYDESLTIEGTNLSLIAVGAVTLQPSTCTSHSDVITVYNADVKIIGFTIDSDLVCRGGIYARGGMSGDGPVSLTAVGNIVMNYEKNGISVNGPEAYGHFTDNTVAGSGPVGQGYWAQNGIQFAYGARGKAMRNTVDLNWYTGEDWTASGILVFETDKVVVQNNSISNSQTGIAIEAWCWYFPSADKNVVVKNSIEGSEYGVSVTAYDLSEWGYSTCNASANNNKVVNNLITATDGDIGIFVGTGSIGSAYTPVADNNKVIRNTIDGYDTPIEEAGTASKVHANVE
jgi:hypothetical protein